MRPRIEIIEDKKLIGMNRTMSLAEDKTFELFSTFMPRKKEIANAKSKDVFDLKVYPEGYFLKFNPEAGFTKWASVEVSNFTEIPPGMAPFELKGGKYAVFVHKGSTTDNRIFAYIFTDWLPGSGFELDNRPHFDVLSEKTKRNDPSSEEEIWIPIR